MCKSTPSTDLFFLGRLADFTREAYRYSIALSGTAAFAVSLSPWGEAATAQNVSAAADGVGTVVEHNGNTYTVGGGTRSGANLFHSFEQFGLAPHEIADFLSNPQIQNVIGRVVGGDPSVVQGLVRLSGGNSNLYLMNPAGWVFTEGASLDVPGSFGATTASGMAFGSGLFAANGAVDFSQLTGEPTALLFNNDTAGTILNQGDLAVTAGQNLWLVGNSVVSTGQLTAPGGEVTLAAVPGGSQVKLSHDGMVLSLLLAANPLADDPQAGQHQGLNPLDLPRLLTGGSEIGSADAIAVADDGTVWLTNTQGQTLAVGGQGDVAIAGPISGQRVTFIAAGTVTPSDPTLIKGDITVAKSHPGSDAPVTYTFIDSRADAPHSLLFGGQAGTITTLVDRDQDGIAQVTDKLTAERLNGEVGAIAIVAEGNAGNFWLGKTWLNADTLQDHTAEFQAWSGALTETADLLLYSCFTAMGTVGENFVNTLAALTGTEVAASVDATGSANFAANWDLEYQTGAIATPLPFTPDTLAAWDGKLAAQTVTILADNLDGADGQTTLREAVRDVGVGEQILFNVAGQIDLSLGAILWQNENVTLDGTGTDGNRIVVDGQNAAQIFNITANTATINNLTLQNGNNTTGSGGGISHTGNGTLSLNGAIVQNNRAKWNGGGIFSQGNVALNATTVTQNQSNQGQGGGLVSRGNITLNASTVTQNSTTGQGGGISSQGNITLNTSTVSNNTASQGGGGVHLSAPAGLATVTDSTLAGNSSGFRGGGIFSQQGAVRLTNTTVSGNRAVGGGGISANDTIEITRSTLDGNSAQSRGGGIDAKGSVLLTNATLSGNLSGWNGGGVSADAAFEAVHSTLVNNSAVNRGGGIYINGNTTFTLHNSIVASNQSGVGNQDLWIKTNPTVTVTHSLIRDDVGLAAWGITTTGGNILGVDPKLSALGNYGGPTRTHLLAADSVAIDAAASSLLSTDQRGQMRVVGGAADIGAVEMQAAVPSTAPPPSSIFSSPLWAGEVSSLTDRPSRGGLSCGVPNFELLAGETAAERSAYRLRSIAQEPRFAGISNFCQPEANPSEESSGAIAIGKNANPVISKDTKPHR